jgi:hypothetical protein
MKLQFKVNLGEKQLDLPFVVSASICLSAIHLRTNYSVKIFSDIDTDLGARIHIGRLVGACTTFPRLADL